MPISHSPNDERIYTLEVRLVQFGKARGIFLGGLDQQPFVLHQLYKPARRAKGHVINMG
jgi:hypothetical protein